MSISSARVVKTKYGLIEGVHGQNPSFTVFKGIPYAAPPIGELRFKPPVEPKPWSGVKQCFRYAADEFIREFVPDEDHFAEFLKNIQFAQRVGSAEAFAKR